MLTKAGRPFQRAWIIENRRCIVKIKDHAIRELEKLDSADLHVVYELIQSLKCKAGTRPSGKPKGSYQRVREALGTCKGSMSDDIIEARQDRV